MPMAARPPLVALKDVRLQDGQRPLFDGVDLAIEPRTRAALVGRNGAGKSTLMKLIMGLIEADAGDRSVQAGTRFAYVPQEPVIAGDTLLDYATSGDAQPWTAEAWLTTFGLDPEKPARNLSGGETRRAALAKAFAEEPDLLLLDEPTNHLDILAIELLENELLSARFAVLVVSHDRAFLNRVTDRVHWLEHRRVRTLDKGFKAFDEWADKVMEEEAESLRRLTKKIEAETYTFYRSITAQRTRNEGRARALMAMRADRAERVKDIPRELQLGVDSGVASGKLVADLKGVTKRFGDRTIFKGLTTRVIRGDRLAIVGPNGAGKTTLVKVLLGEHQPDEGTVRLGANIDAVYLDPVPRGAEVRHDPVGRPHPRRRRQHPRTRRAQACGRLCQGFPVPGGPAASADLDPVGRRTPTVFCSPAPWPSPPTCWSSTSPPTTSTWTPSTSLKSSLRATTAPSFWSATTAISSTASPPRPSP